MDQKVKAPGLAGEKDHAVRVVREAEDAEMAAEEEVEDEAEAEEKQDAVDVPR